MFHSTATGQSFKTREAQSRTHYDPRFTRRVAMVREDLQHIILRHYENMPMQYTEIFKVVTFETFQ